MHTRWRGGLLILAASAMWLLLPSGCASAPSGEPPPSSDRPGRPAFDLPALRLPSPTDDAHRHYLGVEDAETFALADIRTRILIIEVFNFYCPHCQAEAPNINRLYHKIEDDEQFQGQIKIIGIGVGNTPYEVERFRARYTIPFPLFADRSRVLSKQLEVRQTPTFIAWNYRADGRIDPIWFAPGAIGDVEAFLGNLVRASDLK
ncbi:MAG: TlpA disulfide reductase family protein [Desulfobacterales bacterium]|nr:TlpA disulfide reductase family protein [Desulfobacterales bacterium]MDJ0853759.1 TlpA disulfide reductase family protein [Desulfobacterales bacterium]MDJ0991345.1 TlpA disulfide reductase family protein [Desulfobacterales bacterium]